MGLLGGGAQLLTFEKVKGLLSGTLIDDKVSQLCKRTASTPWAVKFGLQAFIENVPEISWRTI